VMHESVDHSCSDYFVGEGLSPIARRADFT
jgi:hypothetical protein